MWSLRVAYCAKTEATIGGVLFLVPRNTIKDDLERSAVAESSKLLGEISNTDETVVTAVDDLPSSGENRRTQSKGTYWQVLVSVDLVNKPLESFYEGPFKVVV